MEVRPLVFWCEVESLAWPGLTFRSRLATVDTKLGILLLLRAITYTVQSGSLSNPESAARGRATATSLVAAPDR